MRILIVNSLYPPNVIGGAEVSTYKLAKELARRGHEVHALITYGNDADETSEGVIIHRRRFHNIESFWDFKHSTPIKRVVYKLLDYYDFMNASTIRKVIRMVHPDVIQANTIYGISPVLWSVAKKEGIPLVQTVRDYYFMCPKANLMHKNGTSCAKPRLMCKLFRLWYRHLSNCVTAVTAPSKYTLEQFVSASCFHDSKQSVIYNAIDIDESHFEELVQRRMKGKEDGAAWNVIYVGGFLETKGIKVLLDAIKDAPSDVVFHFAGKGKLQAEIEAVAAKNPNVIVHGFLKEEQLNELLEQMDILVCPSIWAEPFGRVVIDAYKACIPVIVTNSGGLPELVDDGVTGRVITPHAADEICKAIEEIKGWEHSMTGVDAIREKLNEFSVVTQGEHFEKLFEAII